MSVHRGTFGIIAGVLVALVFLLAGVTKVARPGLWRSEAAGMGVHRFFVPFVPWVEVVLGALLVAQVQRHIVAWFAVCLLLVFTGFIALRLRQGSHAPCACFGALSAKPIAAGNLVRNAVFVGLALAAALL